MSSESSRGSGGSRPRRAKRAPLADRAALQALPSEDLVRLWLETRDDALRDLLVDRHLPDVVETARYLAMRLPRSVDFDDLCNAGCSGLLRCLETFDASKGRPFQSYLRTRAYGSMVDELRAMDWLPRLMRSRLAQRDQIVEALRQDLGRDPGEEDVAAALGIEVEEYRRSYPSVAPQLGLGLADGGADFERLDQSIVGLGLAGRAAAEEAHPLTALYHQELMARIQDLLSKSEWLLVELHYFQGLNLREVAKRLDLSPARICQIHGRVLTRLKERLREEAATI